MRAAGIDAAWQAEIDDDALMRRGEQEQRVVLTLDRALGARGACLLPSHDPLKQLRFVRERFGLDLLANAFTRCPVCNVVFEPVEEPEVPPRVRELCDSFWRCPQCARVYWEGDHVRHMRERFQAL